MAQSSFILLYITPLSSIRNGTDFQNEIARLLKNYLWLCFHLSIISYADVSVYVYVIQGYRHLSGVGVAPSCETALIYYEKAAATGRLSILFTVLYMLPNLRFCFLRNNVRAYLSMITSRNALWEICCKHILLCKDLGIAINLVWIDEYPWIKPPTL